MRRLPRSLVLVVLLMCAVGVRTATRAGRDPLVRLDRHRTVRGRGPARLGAADGTADAPHRVEGARGAEQAIHSRRILAAAKVFRIAPRGARSRSGPPRTADELSAGGRGAAGRCHEPELAHLARGKREKPLTVPLVVLVDLVTRGVPRDTASQTIFQLWQRGAADDDFYGLWRGVERDIVSGTDSRGSAPHVHARFLREHRLRVRHPPPVRDRNEVGDPNR